MITLPFLHRFPMTGSVAWMTFMGWPWKAMIDLTGARFRCENAPPPGGPYLFAANSSHKYDLLGFRYELRKLGFEALTVSKGKNYHGAPMRFMSTQLGSLPLTSRGYILTMDFLNTFERRPSESEYRALRALVDGQTDATPESLQPFLQTSRSVLGARFDPKELPYPRFVCALYEEMMQETLRIGRAAIKGGWNVHVFPQGSVSTRLSKGRIGAVQLAHALDLTVVPVGLSGFPKLHRGRNSPLLGSGEVVIRFGAPYRLEPMPPSFSAFRVEHERRYSAPLQARTDDLMERINALLDPEYQWSTDRTSDGKSGVARFV